MQLLQYICWENIHNSEKLKHIANYLLDDKQEIIIAVPLLYVTATYIKDLCADVNSESVMWKCTYTL